MWMGHKIATGVDRVGEAVVSVIGIDDSMFQDVLDNMTDEQMEAAIALNEEREKEYRDAGIITDDFVPTEEPPDILDAGILLSKQLAAYVGITSGDNDDNKVHDGEIGSSTDIEHGNSGSTDNNTQIELTEHQSGNIKSSDLPITSNSSSSNSKGSSTKSPMNEESVDGVKLDEIDLVA
jgi:hypothetical protein